jgi:hypothetical protein
LLPTIQLLLSSAIISNAGYPLIATPARTVSGATREKGERHAIATPLQSKTRRPLASGYGEVRKAYGVSSVPEARQTTIKATYRGGPRLSDSAVRSSRTSKVIIANGYHRLCAVYGFDEDALIPCKIV